MSRIPDPVAAFLSGKRIAVAGVSRAGNQPANAIFRKLRDAGYDVVAVNPNATEVEGQKCYADLASVPGAIDGVMVVTHPDVSADLVQQAASRGIRQIWFHRSFGDGSVSADALGECEQLGIEPIVGGCPMMFCAPVDPFHRCTRWFLGLRRRIPT
jgi:uncharacterized protein